jgi:hypothetical protein
VVCGGSFETVSSDTMGGFVRNQERAAEEMRFGLDQLIEGASPFP